MGTKSDRYVNLIDEIDELYKGEYQEIKVELKDIFIQIGKDLGWKFNPCLQGGSSLCRKCRHEFNLVYFN